MKAPVFDAKVWQRENIPFLRTSVHPPQQAHNARRGLVEELTYRIIMPFGTLPFTLKDVRVSPSSTAVSFPPFSRFPYPVVTQEN